MFINMAEEIIRGGTPDDKLKNKKQNMKALQVLGVDPSRNKLKNQLGVDDKELDAAIESSYDPSPPDRSGEEMLKNKKQNMKALQVLGVDPSRSKLMGTLGVGEEELKEAIHSSSMIEPCTASSPEDMKKNKKQNMKALQVLGVDPSRQKLRDKLGVSDDELTEAFETSSLSQKEYLFDTGVDPSPELIRKKKQNMKALNVLGVNPSRNKLMEKLGVNDDELTEALESSVCSEVDFDELSADEPALKNKKQNLKALQVLGVDPSRSKLRDTLGVDEEQLTEALEQSAVTEYESIETSADELLRRKKKLLKAIQVLGVDPSRAKLMEKLGITESELTEALQESSSQAPEEPTACTSELLKNKKQYMKALQLLGVNPSRAKLMDTLGLTDEGLEEAEKEVELNRDVRRFEQLRDEGLEWLKRRRGRSFETHSMIRKSNTKAFNLLGVSPSDDKLSKRLGIDRLTLEKAREELKHSYRLRERFHQASLLSFYGFDGSQSQTLDALGIDEDTVERALLCRNSVEDDDLELNSSLKKLDRKKLKKAFALLGFNPSRQKLLRTLGIEEGELEEAYKQLTQEKLLT